MHDTSRTLSAAFIGEESLVVSCAEAWVERGHSVEAVVSDVGSIRSWALQRSIPILASAELSSLETFTPFDYLFSIVNFKRLPEEVLDLPDELAINYHDSPLPRYAGVNATNWAIINGEEDHAITWHVMTAEFDAGPILQQRPFPILPDDTALTLNARAYQEALAGFRDMTDELTAGTAAPTEQSTEGRSYFGRWMRPQGAGLVDWDRPAADIGRLVRGLDHGSYFNPLGKPKLYLGSDTIIVLASVSVDGSGVAAPPGTILEVGPALFTVATAEGTVAVLGVETLAGEPLIPARALADAELTAGDRLPGIDAAVVEKITGVASSLARHEPYWIGRLADLELLPVPYASSQHAAPAPPAAVHEIATPSGLLRRFEEAGIEGGDGLAAALLMYLARIHDRVEFDIGYRSEATSPPIGWEQLFAPYVPLRFACAGSESLLGFSKILATARQDVDRHGTYALDLISRSPDLRNKPGPFAPPLAIEFAVGSASSPPAGAEVVLRIAPAGGSLTLYVTPGALEPSDVERMTAQISTVLTSLAGEDLPVGEVATLPDAERALLDDWSNREIGYPVAESLAAAFEARAAAEPDRVALSFLDRQLTYGELNRRANQVADVLISRGAAPDMLVGLSMERSLDLLVGLLAILKSGAGYLPLDPAYPADRVRYMVEHARAPIVLTQRHLVDALPDSEAEVVNVEDVPENGGDSNPPGLDGPDRLAYVMYTSGSTGRPKGVQITHRNVLRLMEATHPWFAFGPDDVWTLFHSYAFDFTVWEIWGALLYGGRLVIPTHETTRSAGDFLQVLEAEGVTVLNQTPSAFRQLIEADGARREKSELALRYVVFGGEALDLADLRPWVARHGADQPELVNMYGITETTVHVTYRKLTAADIDRNRGSLIGVPIPDLRIRVLDRWMQPTPVGMPGEIFVGGAGLARGYLYQPELTAERFVADPLATDPQARIYKTGDVARYLATGELEYLGRADQQIQLRGFRVELGEIEAVLAAHPAVRKVVVDVKELGPDDQRLVAYYLSSDEALDPAALRDLASRALPDYMVPHHFVALDELPLTPSGKLDRQALPLPSRSRPDTPVPPGSEAERRIAGIWREVLSLSELGVRDTFFDLGGHSLLVMQLARRLADDFGREVSVADVFRYPTIERQAQLLTEAARQDAAVADAGETARKQRQALARQRRRATGRPQRGSGA